MKRGRRKRVVPTPKPKYMYALHRKHPSGIGSIFIRYVETDVKPTFEGGFWEDLTNHEWAKYL